MKITNKIFLFFAIMLIANRFSYAVDGFTEKDRERMIRMEERLESLQKETNTRFESLQKEMNTRFEAMQKELNARLESHQKQIDTVSNLVYFILAGVFGLIGLIFWDRRSYIKPVKEDLSELYNILKEYARKQPEFADILRQHKLF